MVGLETGKSTTTFCVTLLPLSRQELVANYTESLRRTGWLALMDPGVIDEMVEEHLDIALTFEVGAILERRGDDIRVRI